MLEAKTRDLEQAKALAARAEQSQGVSDARRAEMQRQLAEADRRYRDITKQLSQEQAARRQEARL